MLISLYSSLQMQCMVHCLNICRMYTIEENQYNKKLIVYNDFIKSIVILMTRILPCFLLYYWLSMQALVFLIITLFAFVDLNQKLFYKIRKVTFVK